MVPVEYKRGNPKTHDADELQLTAQAMCLEEMLQTEIKKGFLYYGEIRHRNEVLFTDQHRDKVRKMFEEMHQYYERVYPQSKNWNMVRTVFFTKCLYATTM